MEDFAAALLYSIKREMAERYFGFRRQIEEDSQSYLHHCQETEKETENTVGLELQRCYFHLRQEALILRFQELIGLPKGLWYDRCLLLSRSLPEELLAGLKAPGFTRRQRFVNLGRNLYRRLEKAVQEHRETVASLQEEREIIASRLTDFSRNNDLGSILDFLRRIELSGGEHPMPVPPCATGNCSLEEELRLHPPPPVSQLMTIVPSLPSLETIQNSLQSLLRQAYEQNPP